MAAVSGLVDADAAARVALFLLPMLAGTVLGRRRFLRATPESFRRWALILLMALGVAGLVRAAAL